MRKYLPILVGFLLIVAAIWLLLTPNKFVRSLLERLDHLGYDLQLRTQTLTAGNKHPSSPVAIIDIDDRSLKAEGRWPWPRSQLAKLIYQLQKEGAAVIALDIIFSEPENNIADQLSHLLTEKKILTADLQKILQESKILFDEDKQLADALSQNTSVLAFTFLPRRQAENKLPEPVLTLSPEEGNLLNILNARGFISNIPLLQSAAKKGGFINIFADNDGIIRRAPLIIAYQNKIYPSLSLQAVLSFLGERVNLVTPAYNHLKKLEGLQLGSRFIPTDEYGQVLIPFIGRSYSFDYFSATDVLHQQLAPKTLAGKIVFIGTTATGLGDLHATSIQSPFPGVEIQASLVEGMLQNHFSYVPAWTLGANVFLTILFGLIASCLFPFLGPRTLGLIIVAFPPILLLINNAIWEKSGLILSFLMPVLLALAIAIFNIIYGYLFETRRREELKAMFGQYVPEKHIDEMLKSNSDYALQGEDREMSVLFADIRNFTTISEGMPASELVEMLNTFFTPMTEIIFKHQGTIDKYVGDMIMAFWGAPLKDQQHAYGAIISALEMQSQLKLLRSSLETHHWPTIQIGIGINSGKMSVGDMGSRFRRNYTVLGDEVNLASRVEGLTKFYGVDILVTENTMKNQPQFIFKRIDRVRVKGKKRGISIFEVVCKKEHASLEIEQEVTRHHEALDFYCAQNWEAALTLFQQLQQQFPEKKLYSLYQKRIHQFQAHPPAAEWDGIYEHSSK